MKEVKTPQVEIKYEPPRELNEKTVIKWSEHYKRLEGTKGEKTIKAKARSFLRNKCIEYDPKGEKYSEVTPGDYEGHKFICKPIKGYNSTTYRMWYKEGEFECSCQFCQTYKAQCSHITALWLQIKLWNHNRQVKRDPNPREFIEKEPRTLKEIRKETVKERKHFK